MRLLDPLPATSVSKRVCLHMTRTRRSASGRAKGGFAAVRVAAVVREPQRRWVGGDSMPGMYACIRHSGGARKRNII